MVVYYFLMPVFCAAFAAVFRRYAELREEMKLHDKEDKLLYRQRHKDKRIKQKMKLKRGRKEEDDDEDGDNDISGSAGDASGDRSSKRSKINFDSDSDDDGKRKRDINKTGFATDSITLAEQVELALKLLSSLEK